MGLSIPCKTVSYSRGVRVANSEDGALAERLFSERLRWVKRYNNYDPAKPYIISEEALEIFWEGVKY